MSNNKLLRIIVDNREQKLMRILDKKKDKIIYETEQLDVAECESRNPALRIPDN